MRFFWGVGLFVGFFLVNIYLSVGMSACEEGKGKKKSILIREFGRIQQGSIQTTL